MTEAEMLKALELCSISGISCESCPAFTDDEGVKCRETYKTAFDLIKRLKKELKKMDESNAVLFSDLAQEKENYTLMLAKYNAAMEQLGKVRHILAEKCKELDTEKKKVKHGSWFVAESVEHLNVTCSVCRESYYVHKKGQYRIEQSNYCPNCGAVMNGGPDNGTL